MIRHDYAAVNGIRLHYAAAGGPERPLILFLHGFPEFWYAWKNQLEEFGTDHLAVAPDLRGFNLSDKPAAVEAYRAKHLVADIAGLAKHFGKTRFTLVAHDWGGAVGWSFAAAFPQLVERLVIINSPHPAIFQRDLAGDPAQQAASEYMNFFRTPKAERVLSENGFARLFAMNAGWGGKPWMTAEDRAAYLEAWSQPGALTGGLNYYRASPLHPQVEGEAGVASVKIDPAMVTVKVPTLVIWGMGDRALLPRNLEGLDQFVPDLRVVRVEEATHWVVHEQPDLVNRAIRNFIKTETKP
jgi:pimeloyl-ACP methyl ester carboxylesterase